MKGPMQLEYKKNHSEAAQETEPELDAAILELVDGEEEAQPSEIAHVAADEEPNAAALTELEWRDNHLLVGLVTGVYQMTKTVQQLQYATANRGIVQAKSLRNQMESEHLKAPEMGEA
jgi:hypothetical protein